MSADPLADVLAQLPRGPSTVKVLAFLELLGGEPDTLDGVVPGAPPGAAPMILAAAARAIPADDPAAVDSWLEAVGVLAGALRSDPPALVEGGAV